MENKIAECLNLLALKTHTYNTDDCLKDIMEIVASQQKPVAIHVELLRLLESLSDYIPAEVYTKKVIEIKSRIKPSYLQKEVETIKSENSKVNASLLEKMERLKDALDKISTAPLPYNERESRTWIETARQIANEALNKEI